MDTGKFQWVFNYIREKVIKYIQNGFEEAAVMFAGSAFDNGTITT